jgi:hypothetical protein
LLNRAHGGYAGARLPPRGDSHYLGHNDRRETPWVVSKGDVAMAYDGFCGAVMNGEKPRTPEEAKKHLDELLDEALEETFPASDPPAVTPPDDQEPRSP